MGELKMLETNDKDILNEMGPTPKVILQVQSDEQRRALSHPARKQILSVLRNGVVDFTTEIRREEKTLEDGTGLTYMVEVKSPAMRYWMSVPEIMKRVNERFPESEITNFQCYYHLQNLRDHGLVEQYPTTGDIDDEESSKRVRGLRFRTSAQFFAVGIQGGSLKDSNRFFSILNNELGVILSEEDKDALVALLNQQDNTLFIAQEYLAGFLSDTDCVILPIILERLAHALLSQDQRFIDRYRAVKKLLDRSGATFSELENLETMRDAE
ncbi:MAG: hypothetical protein ACFFAX_10310 [Promethearchaeota archaeon]